MSAEELDGFRSELLRQKIVFEAELRRQRESFEERFTSVAKELAAREADCRNLQSVITILGKKVDALTEQVTRRPPTPRRMPTPTRPPSLVGDDELIKPPQNLGDGFARRPLTASAATEPGQPNHNRFVRRPSPLISIGSPSVITVMHRIPSLSMLSRNSSPARNLLHSSADAAPAAAADGATGTTAVHSSRANALYRVPSTASGGLVDGSYNSGGGSVALGKKTTVNGHPHRPPSRRSHSSSSGITSARRGKEEDLPSTASGAPESCAASSPVATHSRRRRSSSLKSKKRTSSVHRLNDVKATDDW